MLRILAPILLMASVQPALADGACKTLRWTTLGTAGGPVPTRDRSEPANLLDVGNEAILIDTGDGTVGQLARLGRDMRNVHNVVLSHLHWDHVGGLSAVIGLRWMNNFPGDLTIHGPPGTKTLVDGIVASLGPAARVGFGTGARTTDPGANLRVIELNDGDSAPLPGGLLLRAATNTHFDESLAQIGTVSLSYRFELEDRSITYSGDTGPSQSLVALAKGSDLLVTEVIALEPLLADITARRPDMSAEIKAQMRQHLATHHIDAAEVGRTASQAKVSRVVMTHFAIPGPLDESAAYLRGGAAQSFHGPIELARDLDSFEVGCKHRK